MIKADSQVVEVIPEEADDFKLIHGIGPGIEKRLHAAGILTYAQLADMTAEQVLSALGDVIGLTAKRVVDQDWINQAASMAADEQSEEDAGPVSRQHYASFMVELLLDGENYVRRTRAVNIQTKAEETWASWEEDRLLDFIATNAGLRLSDTEPAEAEIDAGGSGTPQRMLAGKPSIEEFITVTNADDSPQRLLVERQPFGISMTLDLSSVSSPEDETLDYATTIFAKKLGSGERYHIGDANGSITSGDKVNIRMNDLSLPGGVYRLEAAVNIGIAPLEASTPNILSLFTEGNLVQVY